jgi:hypothetical protein
MGLLKWKITSFSSPVTARTAFAILPAIQENDNSRHGRIIPLTKASTRR